MKKVVLNFWLDLVMFVFISGLGFTGFIMKYVLPPGSGHRQGGGEVKTFLWLSRHDWGAVHFYLAVFLVLLLVVHLILHWNWIICRFRELGKRE